MEEIKIIKATSKDAKIIKNIVNEMYGCEYEIRSLQEIGRKIDSCEEIYILAFLNEECVGFAGATINNDEYKEKYGYGTVIDYIYVKETFRGLDLAHDLIKTLFKDLVVKGTTSVIMQTQTYNKQRFLHYALSNKNIISSESLISSKGVAYDDQILLIEDLKTILNISIKDLMKKAFEYKQCR